MAFENSDNGATLAGYTQEIMCYTPHEDLHLLIKPDADLDDRFRAFCTDLQEYVFINGWNCEFEDV